VTIIGAGPAGLFSAFYAGLRQMKTKIIDNHSTLGGKLHVYPEKMIWDVGGITPVLGEELMRQLTEQAQTFDPTIILEKTVSKIEQSEDQTFMITTNTGEVHLSKTVILAVGGGILSPKKIGLSNEGHFEKTNLHYTVNGLANFRDKTVLISGGGKSAVDWANTLEPIAKRVIMTYRKGELTGHEAEIHRLLNSSAEIIYHTEIEDVEGEDYIERAIIHQIETNERFHLEVDEVIINHGYDRDNDLYEQSPLQFTMHEQNGLAGSTCGDTSVPGIFAAGDSLNYDGKLHLIAGAFQDAANAVNRAKQWIEPNADKVARVSSHNELLKEKNKPLFEQYAKQ
ncbi:MAG: NAD(P)/FAD-dependent oxidoreductase, partial [Coprobacillus sp.]